MGGVQRQQLPVALPRLFQKIHEVIGFLAKGADAVFPGEGKHRHQNSAGTHSDRSFVS